MDKYIFYVDAGHGWLEVPMSEIKRLKIEGKVTPYSYVNGDMVYLEEDCDAAFFIDKLKSDGKKFNSCEVYEETSRVRSYEPYPQKKYQVFHKTNLNNLNSAKIKKRFHR